MLACKLCGFTGDPDQYCVETLYDGDFSGGSGPPVPPLDPHMQCTCLPLSVGQAHFFFFYRAFCKQIVKTRDQMPQNVVSNLGLHCLYISHKKLARLIWVKIYKIKL